MMAYILVAMLDSIGGPEKKIAASMRTVRFRHQLRTEQHWEARFRHWDQGVSGGGGGEQGVEKLNDVKL